MALLATTAGAQLLPQPKLPQPIMLPQTPVRQRQPPMQQRAQQPRPILAPHAQTSASLGVQAYQGTLLGVTNGQAQVQFADGTTQNFSVDASSNASLNSSVGKPVIFRVVKGAMHVANDMKWATLAALKDGKATLQNASKQTQTLAVDAATQAQLQGMVGKSIAFTVNGNALLMASDQASPKQKDDPRDKP